MDDSTYFRLLRAETIDENGVRREVDFAAATADGGSWTTLVTGPNGAGKSRLLSSVASVFDALGGRKPPRESNVSVGYEIDGQECELYIEGGRLTSYLGGRQVGTDALPQPGAVAAATASAFDKFALPRSSGPFDEKLGESSLYKYLGLRDARGRVSTKAGVYRVLEQVFDANSEDPYRRGRVANVFRYLRYQPSVEVSYNWTARGRELLSLAGSEITPYDIRSVLDRDASTSDGVGRRTAPDYLFDNDSIALELAQSAQSLRGLSEGRDIRLVADFSDPSPRHEDYLRMARQLSRGGLAQMVQVVLTRDPLGHRVVLTDASSGELSLVVTLLGIASSIRDSSLILIDEPEISLHPQWQVDYLKRLVEAFADYRGCHFVVATHSPTLVSGSDPDRTTIVDLEGLTSASTDEPPSRSVDEVLVREFGVISDGNLYIRQLVVEALRLVADRQTKSQPFITRLALLQDAVKGLPARNPVHQLVRELGEVGVAGNGATE